MGVLKSCVTLASISSFYLFKFTYSSYLS